MHKRIFFSLCALTHSMDLSRLPKVTEKDIMRLGKYRKSMEGLKEAESSK